MNTNAAEKMTSADGVGPDVKTCKPAKRVRAAHRRAKSPLSLKEWLRTTTSLGHLVTAWRDGKRAA
jgi:hypothetical protein